MTAPVLQKGAPVTLAGGGPIRPEDLEACLTLSAGLVAADGGADTLLALGARPDAVIGDMDSLSPEGRRDLAGRLHPVAEQDSTDFEKCLIRIAAPLVLAVGFTGARIDHALAVFNALVRHRARRCVVVSDREVILLAPPALSLPLLAGTRVSLFPLCAVSGRSRGLDWPLDGIGFAPAGTIGTSNRATGTVTLGFDAPGMLLILPRRCLPELLAGLDEAPHWP